MPRTQSAKKALRQSVRRRTRNVKRKEAYRAAAKSMRALIAAGKKDEAVQMLPTLYKALDKAAKTHAIAKNKASRLKSRLAKLADTAGKK